MGFRIERVVQDRPQQERRHNTKRGREDDQRGNDAKLSPIGAKELADTTEIRAPNRRIGRTYDVFAW